MLLFPCSKNSNKLFHLCINTARFSSKSVGIIGAPFGKGQSKEGVEKGPEALRNFGLVNQLKKLDFDVKDYGNLEFELEDSSREKKVKFAQAVSNACQKVSLAVKEILLEDRKCITLGGDHSLGLGTVHGHSQVHDVCLLWIDAHADINTPYSTKTGHFHGMPCSFMVKELQSYSRGFSGFDWLTPFLNRYSIAYIGLRDLDPFEKYILVKEGILHFTMRDIDRVGIQEVIRQALESINPTGKLSLHVSFDIDSIDKFIVMSTGTPVIGGLTVREALTVAEEVSHHDNFRCLDIMEVNPMLGSKEQVETTLEVAVNVVKTFFGYKRCGFVPPVIKDPSPS